MKVNGLATKGKVLDNPFGGKAVTAYCAGLAVCFFHKVTLIQPEVYLGNALLDIYHIKIICEYLWKDTTQQLLGLHDAKITNTYEIMCMKGEGMQLGFTTDPKVTLIQPEVYLGNALLDIYHIKIICEYLWKDTTQQLLGLHDAKITNTYEIMCMRGRGATGFYD